MIANNIVLYFGSFNPIHKGHISIARHLIDKDMADEVWFVVSPQNPFKSDSMLISESDRLKMVDIAIAQSGCADRMKSCDIEFEMTKPSYTIDTITALKEQYPSLHFSILMGADNLEGFDKWKDYDKLIKNYPVIVYPRQGYTQSKHITAATILTDAPIWPYSSTEVRQALASGHDAGEMLTDGVYNYIKEHKLWT